MNRDINWSYKVCGSYGKCVSVLAESILTIKLSILILLLVSFAASHGLGANEPKDPKAVLLNVIEALKAIKHPVTGNGSVSIKINDNKQSSRKIIDFMFKDRLSRCDRLSFTDNGKRGQREVSWAVGRKYSVGWSKSNAFVQPKPARQFHRQFGYDFHPDTFLRIRGRSLAVMLERIVNGPANVSVEIDSNDILNLIADYKDEKVHQHIVISVDPRKDYRLVSFLDVMEYPNDSKCDTTDSYEIQWKKYGSVWYVKAGKRESMFWIPDAKKQAIRNLHKKRIEFRVNEFHPNLKISDSKFTLEGLQIPKGTHVIDRISGRHYKYGS